MRSPEDALRSVKRYVSEILAPQPVLSELVSSDNVRWTIYGRVDGAFSVEIPTWEFLKARDRHAATVVGASDDPEVYYLRSLLTEDSASLSTASADWSYVDLRLDSDPVVGWHLPLQPEWEVRLSYDYAELPADRPFAWVGLVGATNMTGSAFATEFSQPMTIECVLPRAPSDEATVNALGVMDALVRGFRGPGVGLGRPIRVPLYDYESVAFDDGSALWRHPSDFLRVVDFSVRLLPDPNDVRLVPVVADLRVTWRRGNDLVEMLEKGTRITEEVKWTVEEV